jgi:hypothetical protein
VPSATPRVTASAGQTPSKAAISAKRAAFIKAPASARPVKVAATGSVRIKSSANNIAGKTINTDNATAASLFDVFLIFNK